MSRPKTETTKTTVRMPPGIMFECKDVLKRLAEQGDKMTMNDFVMQALRYFLASIKRHSKKDRCKMCGK